MPTRRQLMCALTGSAAGLWLPSTSFAQLGKSARIVVGFPPGGSADLIARALASQMTGYAQSLIVENKAGAGGRIAIEAVKASEADGATLLITPSSMVSVYPHVYRKLNYDMARDFVPVTELASFPFVLVVGPLVPENVKTLPDFLAWAKANPREASYASPGNGTTPHFIGAMLARASQVPMTHVAYKGGAQAMNDVLGGQIASNMAVISNALPQIQAGKLRALAVTGPQRNKALPQVPTFVESGFRDLNMLEWFGLFAPARVPADQVKRLSDQAQQALRSQPVQEALTKAGFDPAAPGDPASFGAMMKADQARWASIVKASHFTPEE
ncbi:Bug family tripartite tricarboxylate transporter substrate binding protein [Ottowia sp. VDI28]|uniref:Bug family tripartite tricarboxylate transporter substrate binding protein n=1 Tax=Ottowia sp. VDI28 TaxID=3133968 RepID=UPI003C2B8842